MYVISRSQTFCINSILDKNDTCTKEYTSILHLNLSILRELPVYENMQMHNEHCVRNCSTEHLTNLANMPSGGLPEGTDTVLLPAELLQNYNIDN